MDSAFFEHVERVLANAANGGRRPAPPTTAATHTQQHHVSPTRGRSANKSAAKASPMRSGGGTPTKQPQRSSDSLPPLGRRLFDAEMPSPLSRSGSPLPGGEEIAQLDAVTDRIDENMISAQLVTTAILHSKRLKDLPSTLVKEMEQLFRMLQYDDVACVRAHPPELDLHQCAPYAVSVLVRCEAVLRAFGPQVCGALASRRAIKTLAPNLARTLLKRSEDLSPRDAGAVALSQVPHVEDTDAAQHFLSHVERRRVYENREAVREQFLKIIALKISAPHETFKGYSPDDAAQNRAFLECVRNILPENLTWFAHLFVQFMINISRDDRAFDPEFVGWAEKRNMVDRVNKLARRTEESLTPSAGSTSVLEELFPLPAERFFPLFVSVVDSHVICSNLILVCHSRLLKLSFEAATEPLAERISSCSILAKFLAFLVHYPFFASSKLAFEHKDLSKPFREQHSEVVQHSDRAGFRGVDCVQVLYTTVADFPTLLPLVVPWVIRYLVSGPLCDECARAAQPTIRAVSVLRTIRAHKAMFRRGMKLPKGGFAFMRLLCELDAFLSLERVSSMTVHEDSEGERDFSEAISQFALNLDAHDAFFAEFDSVPVDKVATSCAPLRHLRQLLVSFSLTAALPDRSNRRRGPELTQPEPTTAARTPNDKFVRSSLIEASPPRIGAVRDKLISTCLHHENALARLSEFAAKTAPKAVLAQLHEYMTDAVEHGAGACTLESLEKTEAILLEGACARSFPITNRFVQALIRLSLVHESQAYREAVLPILLVKVEEEVEKAIRNKISGVFEAQAAKLQASIGRSWPPSSLKARS